ncbi:MAG: PQQ-binding-like beta-propeller repeat protein [Chloroflexi bacterium]|nr:PQQ-binding-like beta-propeller repeat protein [Chloroflexota bacterium]
MWRTAVSTPGEPIVSSTAPAVSGGVVYVGGMDGNLYAINRADGREHGALPRRAASPRRGIANGFGLRGSEVSLPLST